MVSHRHSCKVSTCTPYSKYLVVSRVWKTWFCMVNTSFVSKGLTSCHMSNHTLNKLGIACRKLSRKPSLNISYDLPGAPRLGRTEGLTLQHHLEAKPNSSKSSESQFPFRIRITSGSSTPFSSGKKHVDKAGRPFRPGKTNKTCGSQPVSVLPDPRCKQKPRGRLPPPPPGAFFAGAAERQVPHLGPQKLQGRREGLPRHRLARSRSEAERRVGRG